jgi:RHH-type proline utilization regulon transcriptional repressor/proline dehydrogenase/delta 1-pyrroline-5-carboxylate dehydrogenase
MSAKQGAGLLSQARALLDRARAADGRETQPHETLACELAALLLSLGERHQTDRDREQAQVLQRMIDDPRGQVFTTLLTDRAYRSRSSRRTVEQARYLLQKLGAPAYLGTFDRLSLGALQRVGTWLPSLSGTAMLSQIQHETRAFILPAAPTELNQYLRARKELGVAVNINHRGEEVLDEQEAERRVKGYLELLERPELDTISVKVSSIYSQLQPLAFEANVERVTARLRVIYRTALAKGPPAGNGKLSRWTWSRTGTWS